MCVGNVQQKRLMKTLWFPRIMMIIIIKQRTNFNFWKINHARCGTSVVV